MDALVKVLAHVFPSVGRIVDLGCPKIVAASRSTLIDHLVADADAAKAFALSILDDSTLELLLDVSLLALEGLLRSIEVTYWLLDCVQTPISPGIYIFALCKPFSRVRWHLTVVAIADLRECTSLDHGNR